MYLKAVLFVIIGCACLALILSEHPTLKIVIYAVLMIWAFCRAYYFVFYVIEKYIDPGYKFSGLFDFMFYLFRKRKKTDDNVKSPNDQGQ